MQYCYINPDVNNSDKNMPDMKSKDSGFPPTGMLGCPWAVGQAEHD